MPHFSYGGPAAAQAGSGTAAVRVGGEGGAARPEAGRRAPAVGVGGQRRPATAAAAAGGAAEVERQGAQHHVVGRRGVGGAARPVVHEDLRHDEGSLVSTALAQCRTHDQALPLLLLLPPSAFA